MSDDPFTQTIEKIWELLEADTAVAALVKKGNRVKLTGDGQVPIKSSVQDGDMPELIIEPAGGPMNPHATSTSVSITPRFAITTATGNLMVDAKLFPLKWALLKALFKMCNDNLDLAFVTNADIVDPAAEGYDAAGAEQRGTSGWSLGLTVQVEMSFVRTDNVVQDPD